MQDMRQWKRRARPLLGPLLAIGLLADPASAQKLISEGFQPMDPILRISELSAPRNQFFINNDEDVELIRFKQVRDIELCAGAPREDAYGKVRGYAIQATWGNETAIIGPGNCFAFDAQQVKVRAASHVPQDIVLTGTVRVIK